MTEPALLDLSEPLQDSDAQIAALHAAGAQGFDPARMHYIDALASRAAAHQGSVRRLLDARLAQALSAFRERFELEQGEARELMSEKTQQHPQAASDLQRLFDAGDFRGLRRLAAGLKDGGQGTSLSALIRRLEQNTSEPQAAPSPANAGARPELKAIRNFRNTWSRLSADTQVTQALRQAPKNAGPINSHMLVLRSLAAMRDISPDYLNRFMSYADTLLSLDDGEKEKPAVPKKRKPAAKTAKK